MDTLLLTRKEKAKELGIAVITLDRWRKAGKIQGIKVRGNKKQIWFMPETSGINESIEMLPNN